jgi:hypothetical protein
VTDVVNETGIEAVVEDATMIGKEVAEEEICSRIAEVAIDAMTTTEGEAGKTVMNSRSKLEAAAVHHPKNASLHLI